MMGETTMTTMRVKAVEPDDSPVRVSLREIREATFRALSARGASHGEAWTAARMVLDAELQTHEGIEALLEDLGRGPWVREKVELIEKADLIGAGGQGAVTTGLGTAATNRLLQHGPLAVDLAAAELDGGGVFVPGPVSGLSCLDAILLQVADARQCSVGVMASGPGGRSALRVARADGALGSGTVTGGVSAIGLSDDEEGLWVCAPVPQSWPQSTLTWVSASDRVGRRAAAAREGALVEAAQWWPIYAASRQYLVG